MCREGYVMCVSVYSYLHWLVVSSMETSLHRMDLRNMSVTSRLTVQQSGSGLTELRSLPLSSALLLDPQSGNLLLSNADSGHIVNCSVVSETCTTLINADTLQAPPNCGGTGTAFTVHNIILWP